jgi:hypothetical protein
MMRFPPSSIREIPKKEALGKNSYTSDCLPQKPPYHLCDELNRLEDGNNASKAKERQRTRTFGKRDNMQG